MSRYPLGSDSTSVYEPTPESIERRQWMLIYICTAYLRNQSMSFRKLSEMKGCKASLSTISKDTGEMESEGLLIVPEHGERGALTPTCLGLGRACKLNADVRTLLSKRNWEYKKILELTANG